MKLCIGMKLKAVSVHGDYVEGEVLSIYQRTFVIVSKKDAKRYLVRLDTLSEDLYTQDVPAWGAILHNKKRSCPKSLLTFLAAPFGE